MGLTTHHVERRALARRFGVSIHEKEKDTRTMSARRVVDWHIHARPDDTYDLHYQGKPILRDATRSEVDKRLRRTRKAGETVHLIERDASDQPIQITDVTRTYDRRHRPARPRDPRASRNRIIMPLIRL